MGIYTKQSDFNPKANFNSVRFGEDTPITECELNELQQIQQEKLRQTLVSSFGNCFLKEGTLTYTSNTLTLAECVVHVEGKVFPISTLTLPLTEGQTAYLDVWTAIVSKSDKIKVYGNSQTTTTITNYLQDSRLQGIETARREQVQYNLVTSTGVADHDYLIVGKVENGVFKDLRPMSYLNDYTEDVEGSYITLNDTVSGALENIEILGNTVQDSSNLADIKSVGIVREDGNYEIKFKSCGKNLLDPRKLKTGMWISKSTGQIAGSSEWDATEEFLEILPNTQYTIVTETVGGTNPGYALYSDTNTNSFITGGKQGTFTTPSNARYIRLTVNKGKNIMLCLGNVSMNTTHEPYQETTSKIILPCQLEKVGDVSDRLFRREDGVWCVEKNINTEILDGANYPFAKESSDGTWFVGTTTHPKSKANSPLIVTRLKSGTFPTEECIYKGTGGFAIRILEATIGGNTSTSLNSWLKNNPIDVKYIIATPEIIELPLDVQISLNSFFGTTNVFIESGEVDGTIKCTMSKSLGGSIKSLLSKADSIEERVEKIENLQKGNDMQVSINNKKYVVVEDTNEGYVTDVRIEGETLVNLFDIKNNVYPTEPIRSDTQDKKGFVALGKDESSALSLVIEGNKIICGHTSSAYRGFGLLLQNLKPTTVYTIIMTKSGADLNMGATINLVNGLNKFNVTTSTEGKWYGNAENIVAGTFTIEDVIVLEGDHTDKDLSYFEGLKSVGDGVEKIELKNSSKNDHLDLTHLSDNLVGYRLNPTTNIPEVNANNTLTNFIEIVGGTSYEFKSRNVLTPYIGVCWYTSDKTIISNNTDINGKTILAPSSAKYCRCWFDKTLNTDNPSINGYMCHATSKPLLYKNSEGEFVPIPALRGIKDNVRDTIELHSDGKYYYHKRCEEVVLNGSEGWYLQGDYSKYIEIINYTPTPKVDQKGVCDKLPTGNSIKGMSTSNPIEIGIYGNGQLRLKPYAKDNMTLTEGIEWLQQNPVTYVYALATEEVYECNYLDLNSYEGETLVQIESGAISPAKLSFKHSTHIGNIVTKMKEDVDKNTKFREEMTEAVTYVREFDNGYEVFEDTKEGSTTIDKIEGNTLVNLLTPMGLINGVTYADKIYTLSPSVNPHTGFSTRGLVKSSTEYTMMLQFTEVPADLEQFVLFGTSEFGVTIALEKPVIDKTYIVKAKSKADVVSILYASVRPTTVTGNVKFKAILLEGDHTQNPPSYFEGLKSVGDLEETLEVSSCGKNLFDGLLQQGYWYDGSFKKGDNAIANVNDIVIDTNSTYHISVENNSNRVYVVELTQDKKEIKTTTLTKEGYFKTTIGKYIRFCTDNETSAKLPLNTRVQIERVQKTNYEPYQGNKKQILYQTKEGNYEKPILRSTGSVSDSIEKHSDGKYYFHKRCEEMKLNGSDSETWGSARYEGTQHSIFRIFMPCKDNMVSDKFKKLVSTTMWDNENTEEGISGYLNNDRFELKIMKTKLSSQDATGFKTWLQSNPVTVVYQLATEEVYECVNLDLDSYEGETSIFLPSTIPAKITASVGSNLIKTLQSMKDRINYLETGLSDITKNGSGWCKLPNGMIMQWGTVYYQDLIMNQWVDKTITLPITLKKCLSILVTTNGHSRGGNRDFYVMSLSNELTTTNSIEVSIKTGTASTWGGVNFLVIGYI